jgi:hypothetical protein
MSASVAASAPLRATRLAVAVVCGRGWLVRGVELRARSMSVADCLAVRSLAVPALVRLQSVVRTASVS